MDEARAVLARLERIESLERGGADAGAVLSELRVLMEEAQAWARRERDTDADDAVARLRDSLRGAAANDWARSPGSNRSTTWAGSPAEAPLG
jgi:hypothetical protein